VSDIHAARELEQAQGEIAELRRAHPQSADGELRHRAAADIARLTEELRLARIEIKALERFCALLSENYDRLLASTRKEKR